MEESDKQNTEPKPPQIFITGVTNIQPLIELLNTTAKDKYLVKTLYNDQVRVQSAESSVYTTMDTNRQKYRIPHLEAKARYKLSSRP